MKKILFSIIIFFTGNILFINAQSLPEIENSEEWRAKIERLSPSQTTVKTSKKRKVLVFSLYTGFKHWIIPHTSSIIKTLANKTNAFDVTETTDIQLFSKKNLKKYDVVILNNTCSKGDNRNIFLDVLLENKTLTEAEQKMKAADYEANLLNYVAKGGGLVVIHGGVTMQNKSPKFGEMIGGSFDYHPVQQPIEVKLVNKSHPLVAAFEGEGFSHIDEPYFFNNAYFDYNFRPLLYMEANKITKKKAEVVDNIKYVAWIKKHGKGRVFYCSPSHNAQSFENPKLLKFWLDGLQYATGDLKCDDSPIGK
jgi:type 1 glutamine amidotransferase